MGQKERCCSCRVRTKFMKLAKMTDEQLEKLLVKYYNLVKREINERERRLQRARMREEERYNNRTEYVKERYLAISKEYLERVNQKYSRRNKDVFVQ